MLDQNWIRDLFRSIGYPIGPPSKLYKDNQATIKRVPADQITPQARPLEVLITALHELYLRKTFDMVYTRSNMQLADLSSKPHGGKSLRNIIDRDIGARLYPFPVSVHNKILCLDQFHGPTQINFDQKNKSDIKMTKIYNACNLTRKPRADHI